MKLPWFSTDSKEPATPAPSDEMTLEGHEEVVATLESFGRDGRPEYIGAADADWQAADQAQREVEEKLQLLMQLRRETDEKKRLLAELEGESK